MLSIFKFARVYEFLLQYLLKKANYMLYVTYCIAFSDLARAFDKVIDRCGGRGPGTHVANKNSGTIWAKVEEERKYLRDYEEELSGGVKLGEKADVKLERKNKGTYEWVKLNAGFVRILSDEFFRFDVGKGKSIVYITIFLEEKGEMKALCDAVQKTTDYSVLVTERGQVVETVYNNIWEPRK